MEEYFFTYVLTKQRKFVIFNVLQGMHLRLHHKSALKVNEIGGILFNQLG